MKVINVENMRPTGLWEGVAAPHMGSHTLTHTHTHHIPEKAKIDREVQICRMLKQDNIVTMVDFFREPKNYLLVFEFVSGGELFDEIVTRTYYNEADARYVGVERGRVWVGGCGCGCMGGRERRMCGHPSTPLNPANLLPSPNATALSTTQYVHPPDPERAERVPQQEHHPPGPQAREPPSGLEGEGLAGQAHRLWARSHHGQRADVLW